MCGGWGSCGDAPGEREEGGRVRPKDKIDVVEAVDLLGEGILTSVAHLALSFELCLLLHQEKVIRGSVLPWLKVVTREKRTDGMMCKPSYPVLTLATSFSCSWGSPKVLRGWNWLRKIFL